MSFQFFEKMIARIQREELETRARQRLCDEGGFEWFSVYHPWQWVPLLKDENFLIDGVKSWAWTRTHRLECFRACVKSKRPFCGAKTRSGGGCRARVVSREDGTLARRCRLHGGLSTGAKTRAGRAAIVASNKRRALQKRTLEK